MKTHSLAISATLLLGFARFASGQNAVVQIRALLHDPSKPDAPFFVGKVGETMQPLKLAEEGLTESQKVPVENGSLNLFTTATVDKNNPQASLAATVKVAEGAGSLIVIILPSAEGTPAYRLVTLDDSPKAFPWGESKAINLTPVEFALEVGDQKLALPAGKITVVPKVTKLDEYNRAQTNFYYKEGDQWVVAAERQMQYVATLRRIFLIYKSPGALAPDVRTIIDQPPPVFDKPR
ncbi:MAG: hypothetical protein ABIT37_21355 [Luteolibacter sp.]